MPGIAEEKMVDVLERIAEAEERQAQALEALQYHAENGGIPVQEEDNTHPSS